jgi:predicted MFS family arabinose efflux permease
MHDAGDAPSAARAVPVWRTLLGDRNFSVLFVAHAASNLGDWLAFLALWDRVGLRGGGGAPAVAALSVSYLAPLVVVMPVAAACVDRWPLRRVLVASDLLRAAVVAAFVWTESLAGQCALLFALQALGCFFNPAQAAAVARLVPRASLVAANALTAQAGHAAKIVGPAVAGLVVGAWGARSAFWVDAASFVWSAAWLATLPLLPALAPSLVRSAAPTGSAAPFARRVAEVGAGLRFIRGDAPVRATLAAALAAAAGLGAWVACFAVLARDRWALAARGTGLVISIFGAGAIAGAALAVPLSRRWSAPRLVPVALAALAVALAAVAVAPTPFLGAAATFALGGATALVLVPAAAWVQAATPQPLQGRVQGAAIAAFGLVQAASLGAAGVAAPAVGAPRCIAIAAAVVAAAAAILAYARPAARARTAGARDTCGSPST